MFSENMLVRFSGLFYVVWLWLLCLRSITARRVKRVIDGREVLCGAQPRIGSLRNASASQHLCGATLLTAHWALTAAHCVQYDAKEYGISLSNHCQEIPMVAVLEIIPHEAYDRNSQAHDIALMRIDLGANDGTWLDGDLLPTSALGFGLTGDCIMYGYGYSNIDVEETSSKLRAGAMKIISLDECTEKLGLYLAPDPNSGMLCAVGEGVDSCQGDSGGPLICDGVIEGLSSYGMSCGVPGLPGVYTSVRVHWDWIRRVMEGS